MLLGALAFCIFFFSSRRRHTRWNCDWSSDVCSSDLLVADAKGASLIAVVGTHYTLEEFLDKGRPGMSSTFITPLRVAGKLVHARGVHQLYQSRISGWSLLVLVLAAVVTVFVAVVFSPASPVLARYFEATWHSFTYWLTGKL